MRRGFLSNHSESKAIAQQVNGNWRRRVSELFGAHESDALEPTARGESRYLAKRRRTFRPPIARLVHAMPNAPTTMQADGSTELSDDAPPVIDASLVMGARDKTIIWDAAEQSHIAQAAAAASEESAEGESAIVPYAQTRNEGEESSAKQRAELVGCGEPATSDDEMAVAGADASDAAKAACLQLATLEANFRPFLK